MVRILCRNHLPSKGRPALHPIKTFTQVGLVGLADHPHRIPVEKWYSIAFQKANAMFCEGVCCDSVPAVEQGFNVTKEARHSAAASARLAGVRAASHAAAALPFPNVSRAKWLAEGFKPMLGSLPANQLLKS